MDFTQIWVLFAATEGLSLWGWMKYGFTWCLERVFDLTMSLGVPSYALAIFIFTIIIKLLMQPLMNKQLRSTRQMGKIQPRIQELQKKYTGNPQKLQQETMKLYKEVGFSPFAGCLPLLIQMPIMIALFQALRTFPPAHPQYFSFFWINNLSDLSSSYPGLSGWILPVITGGATFFQQYLSIANKNDQTQKMMLFMMPVMFGFFTRSFPAFLALYWIYYSLIGAAIQVVLNRRWAREEAIEEAERLVREEEEKRQKKIKKAEQKGVEFVEEEEKPHNTVEVNGTEYILPPGYSLREKRVRAHPYSSEEEVVTVVVLPDGLERPLSSLKKTEPPLPQMPGFNFGLGKKK